MPVSVVIFYSFFILYRVRRIYNSFLPYVQTHGQNQLFPAATKRTKKEIATHSIRWTTKLNVDYWTKLIKSAILVLWKSVINTKVFIHGTSDLKVRIVLVCTVFFSSATRLSIFLFPALLGVFTQDGTDFYGQQLCCPYYRGIILFWHGTF